MKKSKRNLRKSKRTTKRVLYKVNFRKKSKASKMRKNRKHMRKHTRKLHKLKGGGNLMPQDLVNTGRAVQDYFHKMYQNFTGTEQNWSNSNPSHQPDLLKQTQVDYKTPNIQKLNEEADITVNKLLQ